MTKLANFSIETDHLVLLQFKNGQERRVPVGQLAKYLAGPDLAQVSAALELRRGFLRTHMPKAGLVLMLTASSLAALLVTSGARIAAQLLQRGSSLGPVPAHDQVVQQVLPGSNSTSGPGSSHDVNAPAVPAKALPTPRPAHPAVNPADKPRVASRLSIDAAPLLPLVGSQLDLRVTPMPTPPAVQPPVAEPTPTPTVKPSPTPAIELPLP